MKYSPFDLIQKTIYTSVKKWGRENFGWYDIYQHIPPKLSVILIIGTSTNFLENINQGECIYLSPLIRDGATQQSLS